LRDAGLTYTSVVEGSTDLLSHGVFLAFTTAFIGGFLTSLTPCVYPLIPITVSLFGAREENVSRAQAIGLATAYVGGMGTMYAALGVFSALAGRGFGTQLASPWVVVPIAALFLLMAASMFGAFELSLPQGLQQRLTKIGGKGPGGAFAMGLVGGIIAAPCTGPVLASILTYVATTHSVGLGASLLFVYALGMGVLFFLIAAFAIGLPKSGAWMDAVKTIFGISMIEAALYFMRPIAPQLSRFASGQPRALMVGLGIAALGVAIGAIHLSFSYTGALERTRKGFGVALVIAGAWQATLFFLTPRENHLVWSHDEAAAVAQAKAEHKPVLIDFFAEWCLPCKELDVRTFSKPEVAEELSRFVLAKVDCTDDDSGEVQARKLRYNAKTLPTVVILDSNGQEQQRISGKFVMPKEMVRLLQQVH
jgi:thiol:disulfide interchange protein DsbD